MAVSVRIKTEAETKALERYQQELDEMRKKVIAAGKPLDEFTKEMRKLDSQQRALNKLTGETTGQYGKMKDLFGGFTITAGDVFGAVRSVASAMWDVAKAGAEAERATKTLQFATERAGYSWDAHAAAIEKNIQRVSWLAAVDDEELTIAQSKLIRSTGDLTESQKLLGLATDISAMTGKDLEAVTKALGQAYNGQYGALKKLGVSMGDVTSASEGMKRLYEQFGGAAAYVNDDLISSTERLDIAWQNLKENIGSSGWDNELAMREENMALFLQGMGNEAWTAGKKWEFYKEAFWSTDDIATQNKLMEGALGLTDGMKQMTDAGYAAAFSITELNRVTDEMTGAADTAEGSAIALARAEHRLEDANKKAAEELRDHGEASREYEDAALDARQAALDFKSAQDRAAENDATLRALEAERDRLNEIAAAAERAGRLLPGINTQRGKSGGGSVIMAEGGILPATPGGIPVTAAEAGVDEAFIPLERTPRSFSLLTMAAARMGVTAGATYNINVTATSAADIPAIKAAVQEVLNTTVRNAKMMRG